MYPEHPSHSLETSHSPLKFDMDDHKRQHLRLNHDATIVPAIEGGRLILISVLRTWLSGHNEEQMK